MFVRLLLLIAPILFSVAASSMDLSHVELAIPESKKTSALQPSKEKYEKRWKKIAVLAKARQQETEFLLKYCDEPSINGQPATTKERLERFFDLSLTPSDKVLDLEGFLKEFRTGLEEDVDFFDKISNSNAEPYSVKLDEVLLEFRKENIQYQTLKTASVTNKNFLQEIIDDDQNYFNNSIIKLAPFQRGRFYFEAPCLVYLPVITAWATDYSKIPDTIQKRYEEDLKRLDLLKIELSLDSHQYDQLKNRLHESFKEVKKFLTPYQKASFLPLIGLKFEDTAYKKFMEEFTKLFECERLVFSQSFISTLEEESSMEKRVLDSFAPPQIVKKSKGKRKKGPHTQSKVKKEDPKRRDLLPRKNLNSLPESEVAEQNIELKSDLFSSEKIELTSLVPFGPIRQPILSERKQRKLERKAVQERARLWAEERFKSNTAGVDLTPKSLKEAEFDWMNDLNNPEKTIKFDTAEPYLKKLCGDGYRRDFGSSRVRVYIENTPRGRPIACNFHPLHKSGHSIAIGIEHWRKTLLDMLHEAGYFTN